MSKPKIFQQMESAGSFWITDDNKSTLTCQDIYDKFQANIPVFYKESGIGLYQLNTCREQTPGGNQIFIFNRTKGNEVYSITFMGASDSLISELTLNNSSYTITNKSGDTMTGSLLAKAGIANSRQMRNITLSTAEPSSGENGDVWIQYEE